MKVGEIETKDISIVVQGPIIRNFEYYSNGWTNECLKRLRQHFPGAEIILSTWKGSDVSGLDYDILVENDDPGALVTWEAPWGSVYYNLNRQICSTKAGLQRATRKYAMKTRTDTIFNSNHLLTYFYKYPNRSQELKIFKERVIALFSTHPHRTKRPFFISDFLHFGLREDIMLLWDIPLVPEPETSQWFASRPKPVTPIGVDHPWRFRFIPEQYIGLCLVNRSAHIELLHTHDYTKEKGTLTDLLLANNFVLIAQNGNTDIEGIEKLKFPGDKVSGKIQEGKKEDIPKIQILLNNLSTHCLYGYYHRRWLMMYNKYCVKKRIFPHIWHDVLLVGLSFLYHYSKAFYKSIRNRVKKRQWT